MYIFFSFEASVDESSSSASCSTELHAPCTQPQTRLSRAAGQQGRTDAQHTQHAQHAQTRLSRSRQVSTLHEATGWVFLWIFVLFFYISIRVEWEECQYPSLVFGPDLYKGIKTLLLGILTQKSSAGLFHVTGNLWDMRTKPITQKASTPTMFWKRMLNGRKEK